MNDYYFDFEHVVASEEPGTNFCNSENVFLGVGTIVDRRCSDSATAGVSNLFGMKEKQEINFKLLGTDFIH